VRIFDDRYNRDLRRHNLALRFIQHQARTDTIRRWTGLSAFRIRALFHAYAETSDGKATTRHRGASPQRVSLFFRSPQHEFEAAMLAACCRMLGALPPKPVADPERALPGVEHGERVCQAFETFHVIVPDSQITLEHAILLVLALARGVELTLGRCESCAGLIVINQLEIRRRLCVYCKHESVADEHIEP